MAKVIVPISTGFEEIEAITIIDVCRRANISVTIAGLNNLHTAGAHNIIVQADKLLSDIDYTDFDMIVLPGGTENSYNLAKDQKLQEILRLMKEENRFIAAICAAPYALHKADVLNKHYTCYPSFEEEIRKEGYDSSQDVVRDGYILTSRGPGTAMTFALEIVKILTNNDIYESVRKSLLVK